MQAYLEQLAEHVRLADVLDVIVIALLIYYGLFWIRQRAARSIVVGVAVFTVVFLVARWLDMYLTMMIFQAGFTVVILTLIVIFQQDIRRAVERLAWFGPSGRSPPASDVVGTLVESITTLAEHRKGALFVFAGREPLDRHVRGGVEVDGHISLPLLYSIFHPASPGHDGAVMIDGERVEKLGVHLPLSKNLAEVGSRGTRHAAALGLSERCDALVLVVSEERGTISAAEHEELREIGATELTEKLERYYHDLSQPTEQKWYRGGIQGLGLKIAAVIMASALWLLFAYRVDTIQRTYIVPIEYRSLPDDWVIDEPRLTRAELTLSGSERALDLLDASSLNVSFDLSEIQSETRYTLRTEDNLKNVPKEVNVNQIRPSEVTITARHKAASDL